MDKTMENSVVIVTNFITLLKNVIPNMGIPLVQTKG